MQRNGEEGNLSSLSSRRSVLSSDVVGYRQTEERLYTQTERWSTKEKRKRKRNK